MLGMTGVTIIWEFVLSEEYVICWEYHEQIIYKGPPQTLCLLVGINLKKYTLLRIISHSEIGDMNQHSYLGGPTL